MKLRTLALNLLSVTAVAALLWAFEPTRAFIGIYWCLSFWTLVLADAAATRAGRVQSQWAPEDRFIGYLFVAPFVWPVRLAQLLRK